jgi:hypothetical protein
MSPSSVKSIRVGDRIDLSPFALMRWWSGTEQHDLRVHELQPDAVGLWPPGQDPETGEWHIGLEWPEPRDVRQVVVRFAGAVPPNLKVQYWRKNWPTPAPERLPGARRGWIGHDDPWHGQWTTVRAEKVVSADACTFTFDPIDLPELGEWSAAERLDNAEHYLARFRRTLKIRLVSGGQIQPRITQVQAYSTSLWREGQVAVHFGVRQTTPADWSGHAEALNGHIVSVEPLDFEAEDRVEPDSSWYCQVGTKAKGVRLHVLYADAAPTSADRTIVTVRARPRSFSFLVADLDRGPIYIKDYDVLVAWAGAESDAAAFQAQPAAALRPIYDRIPDEPEQSLARAMAEIPRLDVIKQDSYAGMGLYLPLGVEAGRQEWALRYNGELFADKVHLKLAGRDAARLLWPSHQLRFRFGSGDPPDFREGRRDGTRQSVLEGWLPVVTSQWLDREIETTQTAFAALLDGPMTGPDARRGDEGVVALLRFVIRNVTHGRKRARLWIVISPQEQIEVRDGKVVATGRVVPAEPVARQWRVAPYEAPLLRCAINTGGHGSLLAVAYAAEEGASQAVPTAVAYDVDLAGGEAHTITLAAPFVTLAGEKEWQKASGLDFEAKLADAVSYWRGCILAGGQMDLPDTILSDFHKAVRAHVAITADKDPVCGLVTVPAATYSYGVCANEACWQITMLDQAGHHNRAETYLETFLATQSQSALDGNFTSNEGVMQGLDLDAGVALRSHFAYNLDPGFIMECLANHYRLTGDQAWLKRVAPKLVSACDFVIRERQNTKTYGPDGKPAPEWGLMPAGHLEDNPEWLHWFAVNAHAYNGMQAIAGALTDIQHPEASRLTQEAASYRDDIRQAARRAMVEAPVVRLLDGTYAPHVPPRTGIRGREWGWIREAAYGALHLLEGNVFDPGEEEMTWVLKDLEDNLYVSRDWGRPVDLERYWFSHGGATIQANLTDLAIDYLRRGQVKHALRALFNNFGASLYPNVRVFTEHPVVELGHGVGPFYKTSDESKALVWLRAFLLHEDGDRLHLASGAPRAWFAPGESFGVRGMASFFGPVTYRVTSGPGQVTVQVEVPKRRPPQELIVHLRLLEGQVMKSVTVNGSAHKNFDPAGEVVRVTTPSGDLAITVDYSS